MGRLIFRLGTLVILCKYLTLRNIVFITAEFQGKSDVADMDIRGLQRKYQNFVEVTVEILIWKFQVKYEYVDNRGILLVHFTKSANVVVKISEMLQRHRKL